MPEHPSNLCLATSGVGCYQTKHRASKQYIVQQFFPAACPRNSCDDLPSASVLVQPLYRGSTENPEKSRCGVWAGLGGHVEWKL